MGGARPVDGTGSLSAQLWSVGSERGIAVNGVLNRRMHCKGVHNKICPPSDPAGVLALGARAPLTTIGDIGDTRRQKCPCVSITFLALGEVDMFECVQFLFPSSLEARTAHYYNFFLTPWLSYKKKVPLGRIIDS